MLCNNFWAEKNVFFIASLGLAALFLPGGKISHIKFKIPIDINKLSKCHIPKQSIFASSQKKTALIVRDEILMQHKYCFAATNRSIGDIKDNDKSFIIEIPMLLDGDFTQTTPVVFGGSRA